MSGEGNRSAFKNDACVRSHIQLKIIRLNYQRAALLSVCRSLGKFVANDGEVTQLE